MAHAHHIPLLSRSETGLFGRATEIFLRVELALRVARERRQLLALNERALKDLGLSQADAHNEATRGFWDIPSGR